MKEYSLFDIIGPIMIGPSSSHTAGACRIGYAVHHIVKCPIKSVVFTLYGSFARTYRGHGTDLALLGGVLGLKPDDSQIVSAFELAKTKQVAYSYVTSDRDMPHPNTVMVSVETTEGQLWEIVGESIGGGKIVLTKLNAIDIEFTGAYNTLITHHQDSPGLLASITKVISESAINIANMKLYREAKGQKAIGIIELDDAVHEHTIKALLAINGVHYVNLIEKIYE